MNGQLPQWRKEELEEICGHEVRELLGGITSDSIQEVLEGTGLAGIAERYGIDIEELKLLAWCIITERSVLASVE